MPAKIAIMTNIPAPYRVDFFRYLQKTYLAYEFHIIFQAGNDVSFRNWDNNLKDLTNVHFLSGKPIQDKNTKTDQKEIILTKGIAEVLDTIKPDLCVIYEYNQTAIVMRKYCTRRKIPYVSCTDGTRHSERNLHFYHKLARKYIIKKASAFIASSSDSSDNQVSMGADRNNVFISELAVDIHRFDGCGNNYNPEGYLLTVGSLVERKGIDLLLRALSHCKDIEWTLHLVGSGDARGALEALAEELGIRDRIIFKGYLEGIQLISEYENAGIYIFPTREDCFGLVTLEAMCCGLPVIASKYAGSSRDMVKNGVNGYVVDPFAEKEFAGIIRKTIIDKEKLEEMSSFAKNMIGRFDFCCTSRDFINAIEKGLSSKEEMKGIN